MHLTQEQFLGAELVRVKNHRRASGDEPEYYEKYAVRYYKDCTKTVGRGKNKVVQEWREERECIFGARVTDVIEVLDKGENIRNWGVMQALNWALGEPVLTGVLVNAEGERSRLEYRGSYQQISRWQRECEQFDLQLDHSESFVQPWKQYSEVDLLQRHKAAFDARYRKRDQAGEYGTRAHWLIERWIRYHDRQDRDSEGRPQMTRVVFQTQGGRWLAVHLEHEPVEVQASLQAFHDWFLTQQLEVVAIEQFVADLAWGVAGTVDCVVRDKEGRLLILDWKTSNGVYAPYLLQVRFYKRLWELCNPTQPIDRCFIIRLDKKSASVQIVEAYQDAAGDQDLLEAITAARWLHRWVKRAEKHLEQFKAVKEAPVAEAAPAPAADESSDAEAQAAFDEMDRLAGVGATK